MKRMGHHKNRIRGYKPIKTTSSHGKKGKKKRQFISTSNDSKLNSQGIKMERKNSVINKIIGCIGIVLGCVLLFFRIDGSDGLCIELGNFKVKGTTIAGGMIFFSFFFLLKSNPRVELKEGKR